MKKELSFEEFIGKLFSTEERQRRHDARTQSNVNILVGLKKTIKEEGKKIDLRDLNDNSFGNSTGL